MEVDFVTSGLLEDETVEFDESNDNLNFEGERCGLCMDIIIDRGVLDCCQHWFCFGCIDNWASITNLCPLCQSEFQLITCVPVYDTIGNNKVDEDSFSRNDDWCIEGKSNTLSFPSYYIDENAVTCVDGDGCKIRSGSATVGEDSNLDTSIACDSCDVWYHAFCVGFDPEGTYEDTWLCPRCAGEEVKQKCDVTSIWRPNNQCDPESSNGNCLADTAFSGKMSVSVADAGETALVVSMVGENKWTEEPSENFHSTLHKDLKVGTDRNGLKAEVSFTEKADIQPILEAQGLELSLSCDASISQHSNSLVLGNIRTSCADESMNEPSRSDVIKNSLRKLLNDSTAGRSLSESESTIGLHLGLSVGCYSSVDCMKNNGAEDQVNGNLQQQILLEESSLRDEQILHDADEEALKVIGMKRKHIDHSDDGLKSGDEEANAINEAGVFVKKIKAEGKFQMTSPNDEAEELLPVDPDKCPQIVVPKDVKSKQSQQKEGVISDIMSIVQGAGRKPSKGLACWGPADKSSKERENAAGLRVKKIMRRVVEDKESSIVVQKLRKEIREAVRNKSSTDIGENLFDEKLLTAFRTAIAGSTTEPLKLPPSALKSKKSMLQKGKIRENLTKKIYGNSNGRRRRAWDRDCEVEFWKHRCMRATKPEKIATLKSVLNLLKKSPDGLEVEQSSECQATNPILSRLYLADTSVFPRKDDIKPLSAFTGTTNPEQSTTQPISVEKSQKTSLEDCAPMFIEPNKVSSKFCVPLVHDKGCKDKFSSSKARAGSNKANPDSCPEKSLVARSGGSKVKLQKETGVQSDNKIDKRKWALEVLARKKALAGRNTAHEKQEDNVVLKGNYPLLAQLPVDMRPELAISCHNKIPVSVRQTQLYRLTEHFLRKLNLSEIRRSAETELAVADAINIEKEVADKSNSKPVYLNLCSREILHRSDTSKSIKATESNCSSPSTIPVDRSEQANDELPTDPAVIDALRNAGLLSDSPPSSLHHKMNAPNEVDDSLMQVKEEERDNIFEMDSHPDVDIYGDFEYDLEDEDYIGAAAMKVSKLPSEEGESRMKVVFSTLKSERMNDDQDFEDPSKKLGNIEEAKNSPSLLKDHSDGVSSSTMEGGTEMSRVATASEEGEEPSLAECEELYGPDKEPLISKFPEEASRKLYGPTDAKAPAENKVPGENENYVSGQVIENAVVASVDENTCNGENNSEYHSQTSERQDKSNTDSNKQCEVVSSVLKKVEAYIKEHIRPLCKSGIITAEHYRWAVAKTTDKVMKYHANAKNANFLIKEGEKVKKLAEKYVETAQQKEKSDLL